MEVFDLSQVQAEYILELRLRRLTKFSRIELEAERDKLRAEIAELEALLGEPAPHRGARLRRARRGRRALRHAAAHPADRCAAVASPEPRPSGLPLPRSRWRMSRAACSSRPRAASPASTCPRAPTDAPEHHDARTPQQARRHPVDARHDEPRRDRRGHEPRATHPVHAGRPADAAADFGAARRRRARSATTSRCPTATRRCSRSSRSRVDRSIALGTKQGVVKRVSTGAYPNKPEFEVIGLKAGDEVVGVVQGDETDELVFVASDAQLLRFPAASVRPQGCPAGGMAGINLASGAHVIYFTSVPADRRRRRRRRHDRGEQRHPARHRPGQREGQRVRGVPGEGPGHRRRARAAIPEGRGRAAARLGRPLPRARGRHRRLGSRSCPTSGRSATRRASRSKPRSRRWARRSADRGPCAGGRAPSAP